MRHKTLKKITALLLFFFINTSFVMSYNKNNEDIIKNNTNENMEIAITFDDGPHPKETSKILDILKKYDAKATFFVVGKHVKWYPDSVIRASEEGHEIGNHTFTHPDISTLCEEQIKSEIKSCEDIIIEKTNKKPVLFRPPFGNYNKESLEKLSKDLGYTTVLWSGVDVKDWKNPSPNNIADEIINNVKSGDIILLHDYGTENTVKALDMILPKLKEKGYKFVTVSQLLDKKGKEIEKNSN